MVFAILVWGLSWTNAKIAGRYADPQLLMFWRFIFASVTMVPLMLLFGIKPKLTRKSIPMVLLGAVFMVLYNFMYFKGTQVGQAGLGGVITTTLNPMITYIFVVILFRKKVHQKEIFGVSLGVLGGLILLKIWDVSAQTLLDSGNIYFVAGAGIWAIVTITTQKAGTEMNVINFSFWIFFISIIFMTPFVLKYEILSIFTYDWIFWVNFLAISVGSLAIATTIFFRTTMKLGSEKSASFVYIVPASAMLFAMIILGETLEWTTIVGGGFAIAAVYLINRGS